MILIKTKIYIKYIELIILIGMFYRFFSKKIYMRSNENMKFLSIKRKVLKPFYNLKRNYRDRNECIYKKCKYCKKLLNLPIPNSIGIKQFKCPKCKKTLKCWF